VGTPELIVVGLDGSEGSRRALRFALREARIRRARVQAVAVWHIPWAAYSSALGLDVDRLCAGMRDDATRRLQEALDQETAEAHGLDVLADVREGQPAQVLVELSAGASLLVVGSRGLGGFRDLLLGSVSHQCAQHAACPVVIVPTPITPDM